MQIISATCTLSCSNLQWWKSAQIPETTKILTPEHWFSMTAHIWSLKSKP